MAKANYEPVVFEDAQGNPISNDPVWLAQQTLKNAGVGQAESESESDDDEELDTTEDYSSVKGKDLTALAKQRGVELTKGIKAGEVRQLLMAQDAEASVNGNDAEDEEEGDEE